MIFLNLFVQFPASLTIGIASVLTGPWSIGNGFRPSSSYRRPSIGTKQMKWKSSAPGCVDTPSVVEVSLPYELEEQLKEDAEV